MDDDRSATGPSSGYQAEKSPFRPPPRRPVLDRIVPVAEHVPGYRGETLGRDALAGITVAALALPAAMAYGELAGLSPVIGLYTLLLPAVAYAVFGSSRQLIVGPEGAIAAMVGAALIPMTPDPVQRASLAALLALLVGAAYVVALLARLGWIADYLSRPVLIGYMNGVAVVMIVGQLGKLFGLSISAETPPGQVDRNRRGDRPGELADRAGGRCLPGPVAARPLAGSQGSRAADRRGPCDRRVRGLRPGRVRSGRGRRDPGRPAQHRAARSAVPRRFWTCCRPQWASSSSASPMRSSSHARSPGGTASTSAPTPS